VGKRPIVKYKHTWKNYFKVYGGELIWIPLAQGWAEGQAL
jgi:hypothetical protein